MGGRVEAEKGVCLEEGRGLAGRTEGQELRRLGRPG